MPRFNRRAFLRATGGAVTLGTLAGCTGGGDGGDGDGGGGTATASATSTPAGPVVIGGLEPLSGNFAPWGAVHQAGLQFAIDEVNEMGGVLGGRELELSVTDTGSDPAQADSSFRRMVEQEGAAPRPARSLPTSASGSTRPLPTSRSPTCCTWRVPRTSSPRARSTSSGLDSSPR